MEETEVIEEQEQEVDISDVTTIDVEALIEQFYSEKWYVSYSGLKKLCWSPMAFFNWYILKQKEDKLDKSLVDGKVIHCLLLNKETYNQNFVTSPTNLPTGNNKLIVQKVYNAWLIESKGEINIIGLKEYGSLIIDILADINLHQSLTDEKKVDKDGVLKTGNQKRLEKILTPENISYFEFLKGKGDKTVIDQKCLDRCNNAVGHITRNKEVCQLMGLIENDFDNIFVHSEVMLYASLKKYDWGLRGIIDNYVINHDQKIIFINDLKTNSKSIAEFSESVEFYQYWLQAVIYIILIKANYKQLIEGGYKVEFRFIVYDVLQQIYPFKVSDVTMKEWEERTRKFIADADYHYQTRKYELPRIFLETTVEL